MTDALAAAEAYLDGVDLLGAPGAVVYSGVETLRPGPVYLLGLNPGGSETSTLRDSIVAARTGRNAYLDEAWAPGGHVQPIGQSTLQRRVQGLCAAMGMDTRDVPASNLVFTRSTRVGTHLNFAGALRLCLPVHRIFLDVIRPRFLMTFGAIENVARAAELVSIESRSAEHATWMAHRGVVRIDGRELRFGNIPHLSVWASDRRSAVVRWAVEGSA